MDYFLQQVINGLQIGFVYALIALGYTMVYGVVGPINFAHGDVFMVGAFIGLYAIGKYHLPLFAVFLLATLGCAVLAVVMERVAYRPLRQAPRIAYPQVNTFMGVMPGLKAFTAAVLGGIGSIPGAVLGALIMGQSETLASAYLSSTYRDGIAFVILIGVLLLRPTGILGTAKTEKV